jgi:RES domain-containing protein
MFAKLPPDRENIDGARWNPRGVAAIYTSLERETALAEAEFRMSFEPLRPSKGRILYHLRVTISRVLDLRLPGLLEELGIPLDQLSNPLAVGRCREVGGAAAFLGNTGILVPSVRHPGGSNLVVLAPDEFEVVGQEDI